MQILVAVLVVVVLGTSASAALDAEPGARLVLTWQVDLAADGHVERLDIRGEWPRELRERLEKDIRTWRFSPGRVNGTTAPTRTSLHVSLRITPVGKDGWQVHIENAFTGASIRKQVRVVYPGMAANGARQGLVIMRVAYDEQGKVVQARVAEDSPVRSGSLVGAARSGMKRFEFEPERVGDRPIAGEALLPVCFNMSRETSTCTWKRRGSNEVLDEGSALAFDTEVELVTEVTGRTLSP